MPRPRNRDCGVDPLAAINEAACAGPGGRFVTTSDRQAGAPMDQIVITDELESRGERPNSQAQESEALLALARAIALDPASGYQALSEVALGMTGSDAAGVSVLERVHDHEVFRWRGVAGDIKQ